jgi:hypothetical protein
MTTDSCREHGFRRIEARCDVKQDRHELNLQRTVCAG